MRRYHRGVKSPPRFRARGRLAGSGLLVVAVLMLHLATSCTRAGPQYERVEADLCDELVPLLDDLQASLQVNLVDEFISGHRSKRTLSSSERVYYTECYYTMVNFPTGGTLWVRVTTCPSPEDAEAQYRDERELLASRSIYDSTPAGVVEGAGEQAEAFLSGTGMAEELELAWYGVASRDMNLAMRIELEIGGEPPPSNEALAEVVHPLATDILAWQPKS
jgi:hypothetical protein